MSLLDKIRQRHHHRPLGVEEIPAAAEVPALLGGLIGYAEHGEDFLNPEDDASDQAVPAADANPTVTPAPADVAGATPTSSPNAREAELEARIQDLQAQLDARQATDQRTQLASHEIGAATNVSATRPTNVTWNDPTSSAAAEPEPGAES